MEKNQTQFSFTQDDEIGTRYIISFTGISTAQYDFGYNTMVITGADGAIDNPNWGWDESKDDSGDRRIPFVPDLDAWNSGAQDYWDGDAGFTDAVGADHTDVVSTEGTIPMTRTEVVTNEEVTDSDIIEDAQAHAEGSTSLKALFFFKISFLPSLGLEKRNIFTGSGTGGTVL